MIYSDRDLKRIIKAKKLGFEPVLKDDQIGPASIDLKLADEFKMFRIDKFSLLDTKKPIPPHFMETIKLEKNEPFIVHPGSFIIASTSEYVKVSDDIVVTVEGKSSLARMGILVHTAGFVDPGFEGTITLEISNQSNIAVALYAGMYICQIAVSPLSTPAENPYNKRKKSLYMGQKGPTMTDTRNLFKNN
jgi:dCTP deaminase